MKATLLSPPFVEDYMRNARCDFVSLSHSNWYPLWLGYCGAVIEQAGHEVQFIDAPALGIMHDATLKLVKNFHPDLLVVYSGDKSKHNDVRVAEMIKKEIKCKIVFVGPYVSAKPEEILELSKEIDFAVKGEFEFPVLELIEGKSLKSIKNLVYQDGEEIKKNMLRPLLNTKQLDNMPFVTQFFKKHLNVYNYKTPSEYYPFIDTMTGRGCQWGHCTFCLWVHTFIPGAVYNLRSVSNVIEELKFIKSELPQVKSIMFQDDTMTTERAEELCNGIMDNNLNVTWSCYARANMQYPVLKKMKDAGCRNLHVGFESANQQILKNIKKGTTIAQMKEFADSANKAGLQIHADFAIGYPGENSAAIRETIEFAKQINPHTAQFQLYRPLQGTPDGEFLRKNGQLTSNGYPNYSGMSEQELREWAKKAYREFYFSWGYIKKGIANPKEYIFSRLDQIVKAIPAFTWKRWD